MSLGSFYPNVLFSGVLWPVEGFCAFIYYCKDRSINEFMYYFYCRNASFYALHRILHASNLCHRIIKKCICSGLGNRKTRCLRRHLNQFGLDLCNAHLKSCSASHSKIYGLIIETPKYDVVFWRSQLNCGDDREEVHGIMYKIAFAQSHFYLFCWIVCLYFPPFFKSSIRASKVNFSTFLIKIFKKMARNLSFSIPRVAISASSSLLLF